MGVCRINNLSKGVRDHKKVGNHWLNQNYVQRSAYAEFKLIRQSVKERRYAF